MKAPRLLGSLVSSPRRLLSRLAIGGVLALGVAACATLEEPFDGDSAEDDSDGEDTHAETSEALVTAGPCAGKAIDRAVKCAQAKGARVLSYSRSPADQERVRRENHCKNRCTGQAGCVRHFEQLRASCTPDRADADFIVPIPQGLDPGSAFRGSGAKTSQTAPEGPRV